MRLAPVAVAFVLVAGGAHAEDKLVLKDGQVVAGKIVAENDMEVRILSNDKTTAVPKSTLKSIERDGKVELLAQSTTTRAPRAAAESGARPRGAPEATPELLKWIDVCVQHLGSADAGVRQGATVALRAAGPAAKPALEKAQHSDNAQVAQLASSVLSQLSRPGAPAEARRPRGGRLGPGGPGTSSVDALMKQLGLSAEQQPKVEGIFDQHATAQEEVSKSAREGKIPKEEAKAKITALRAETEGKLAKVLTPEQMKKYKELNAPAMTAPAAAPAAGGKR